MDKDVDKIIDRIIEVEKQALASPKKEAMKDTVAKIKEIIEVAANDNKSDKV